jgi:predicted RecA/RadA family phage recombinase
MTKAAGTGKTFAVGAKVYRDATNKNAVSGSTGNVLIGMCVKAAAATDTTVEITAYPIVTAT